MGKVCLVIIDGFGISESLDTKDATKKAENIEFLKMKYPFYKVKAHGEYVGLPDGMMGNSEVGHITIGSGRIVKQSLLMIDDAWKSGHFKKRMDELSISTEDTIHLIGMVSDGGVHSHVRHLRYFLEYFKKYKKVFIHAIADGRDTEPNQIKKWLKEFDNIVSIAGRYYTMDRDKNMDRIELSFKMMTEGKVKEFNIDNVYEKGITDEFIEPTLVKPINIKREDTIIFFNFRADRMKQIVNRFKGYGKKYTLMDFDVEDAVAIFNKQEINNTLPQWLSVNNIKQAHIAETEKYAHVTYFFNGGNENRFSLESHIMIDSPKIPTFDLQPETSSPAVAEACIDLIKQGFPFIVVNFASTDLVGHTGNYEKTCEAVSRIDSLVYNLYLECVSRNYTLLITADHGNSEQMEINGDICKTHTTNDVPLIIVNSKKKLINRELVTLADIAPTICDLFDVPKPEEMTGISLIDKR